MWVLLTGSIGTAKTALADILAKDGFFFPKVEDPKSWNDSFDREFSYLAQRTAEMESVKSIRDRGKIVTIRSIWDTIVFARAAVKSFDMSEERCEMLTNMVRSLHGIAEKPDMVVYAYAPKISAIDRATMKGNLSVDDMFMDSLLEEYDDFVKNIEAPMIDVDVTMPYEAMREMLTFNMASIGSTRIPEETIWKKDFVNEFWMAKKN